MKIKGDWKSTVIYALRHGRRVIYVGKTSMNLKQRIGKHFQNAVSVNGRSSNLCPKLYAYLRENPDKEQYSVEVLSQCRRDEADEKEIFYIEYYKTKTRGCNVTAGGTSARGSDHYMYGVEGGCPAATAASVAARIGKKLTEDHKSAARESYKKNRMNHKNLRIVRCKQTGKTWNSLTECAEHFGVAGGTILNRLDKEAPERIRNKKLGTFTFEYI